MRRSQRKFGIELEFECTWEHLKKYASKIIKTSYGPRMYYAKKESFESDKYLNKWHIKLDGLDTIAELTSPISTLKDLPKIKEVVTYLRYCKPNPSDDCGFHVHINVSDIDQYHFMSVWMIYERAILSCFPLDRRNNAFCSKVIDYPQLSRTLIAKVLEQKIDRTSHSQSVSFCYYDDRKTVEIRVAEGTDNPEMVENWIGFLLYFTDYVKKSNPSLVACKKCNAYSFEEMIEEIPLSKSVRDFMEFRFDEYGSLPYWVH